MARALAANPPVLLMDEPFYSAVDPVVRASLQEQLLSLQAELRKTNRAGHPRTSRKAIKLGDTVALFHPHGTLAQVAPPQELLAAPADDYVVSFVGFDRRHPAAASFVATGGLQLSPEARCRPLTRPWPRR